MSVLNEKFIYVWSAGSNTSHRVIIYVVSYGNGQGDDIKFHAETSTDYDGDNQRIWTSTDNPSIAAIGLWAIGQNKGERYVRKNLISAWEKVSCNSKSHELVDTLPQTSNEAKE